MKRALAAVLVVAAVAAGSAGAAPPKTGSLAVSVQSALAFGGLQGGQGDTVLGLQGSLAVATVSPQLTFVTGGSLTGKGTSGAGYSFDNALGVLSPFGGVLFFVARVTAPSAADQKLRDAAADDLAQADKHSAEAAALLADAAQDQANADELRAAAQREREEADRLIAAAAAAEAAAANLERPTPTCVVTTVKPGTLSVAGLRPC